MNNRNQTKPAERVPFNYGYIVVAACFIIVMMNVGMYLTMGVFFKPISIDMNWTRADTSLPISFSTIITAIATIVAGNLFDRFGPRLVSLIFVLLTGAGYLLMSRLTNLWELYIYYGIMIGVGSSLMSPFLSIIPRWFKTRRTVMAGVISAGGGVGGLCLPLVADWLIRSYNWHRAYLIMGIGYLVLALIAVQFLRRSPQSEAPAPVSSPAVKESRTPGEAPGRSLKGVVLSRNFGLMVIMVFTFGFVANTINLHSAPNATDIGFSSTAAAGLLSIMNGVSIVGCILLGMMGDKFGNKNMLLITFAFEGAVMVWLAFIHQLWMMNVFMIVYGLFFGSGLAQISPLVARLFGTRSLGLILGLITFTQTIGSGLGIYIPGWLYDMNKNYFWAFMVCGILCAAAVIATLSIKNQSSKTTVRQ
jgi:MFS family permease